MLLCINEDNRTIEAYDESSQSLLKSVSMSVSSLNIAKTLFKDTNSIYSREELINSGWPEKSIGSNSLNVSIMKLRRKLETIDEQIEVKSYPSLGYKLLLPVGINVVFEQPGCDSTPFTARPSLERKPNKQSQQDSNQTQPPHIRWGDLFLSVLILSYSGALYYSLYLL